MIFQNEHALSLGPKYLIVAALAAAILASGLLMFVDIEEIYPRLEPYRIRGDLIRRVILLSCSIVYLVRLLFTLFVFLKRKFVWTEAMTISVIMPSVLFAFVYVGGNNNQPFNPVDIIGILLYLCGSYLNTRSEYLRHIWKKKPENSGRLYTGGLFKYSRHINYFADVVLFTGFAMLTQSITMIVIPFVMTLNFAIILIPRLDEYLEAKYGKDFAEYVKRTKRFIPMVY